jgi:hypothetical protein
MQESTKIDVGEANEEAQEIDLDAPTPEQSLEEEIQVEQISENNTQSTNTTEKLDEQSTVQAGEKKEEKKEELEKYSDGVQKRIAKLTHKMREAERQKEEAIAYAQQLQNQAAKVKGQYDSLGNSYTKELEAKVQTGMDAAKLAYKQAIETQNVEAQVEAQKAIAQMAMEESRLNQIKKAQEQRDIQIAEQKEKVVPQTQVDPYAQATQQVDPKAETWASKNAWFGTDNAMTYTAFDIHKKLVEEEGFDPQSDDYYSEVDKRIRLEFPHKFDSVETTTAEQPAQTVASAKRPAAGKGRRKTVKLTPSQVAISKRLGVPLEEYAKQLAAKEG